MNYLIFRLNILPILLFCFINSFGQNSIRGVLTDETTGEPIIGATIYVEGTSDGAISDYDGTFQVNTEKPVPFTLIISYLGYDDKSLSVSSFGQYQKVSLAEQSVAITGVEVVGQRITDKQKAAPLTVESLDAISIKQTASNDFYNGLGALKGVDLTTASIGFTIINTRGFNSTSPVRSLQTIDGVDNQSPGLNFSLGNFLGAPELDIQKVDLVVGASSAFYGPNAFNGVIAMETKNPYYNKGLSASIKFGERKLIEGAVRYASVIKNKSGLDAFAYKLNVFGMKAHDWEADNEEAVYNTDAQPTNPGGYDKVNSYGDEYSVTLDYSNASLFSEYVGLNEFHRDGYNEKDVVNYDSKNFKGNLGLYYRLQPAKKEDSPELIYGFNIGNGTTVYQGDNRFSLRNILFFQNKLEIRKRDKYFFRIYSTQEDAGDSYDPYFTSLLLTQRAKTNVNWGSDYVKYWQDNVKTQMIEMGYPVATTMYDPITGEFKLIFDFDAAQKWLDEHQTFLSDAHKDARIHANTSVSGSTENARYEPGTDRFNTEFNKIISTKSNKRSLDSGTKFFDQSALYHAQGEYKINPSFAESMVFGGSFRYYRPNSEGTIFYDTADVRISNKEFGLYTGIEKRVFNDEVKLNATIRVDKNENFDWLLSPALSAVYSPSENNFFRLSFSSALRNPTLTDQYLYLDVGPAILAGNLNGVDSLIPVESFKDYIEKFDKSKLTYFNVSGVRPEKVKSLELGYRTTLFNRTYIDGSIYYSRYSNFLGYVIGIKSDFDKLTGFPQGTQAYRLAANSVNNVTTQGFSIGVNHYFASYYMFAANYSWNKLNKLGVDDPIIPAFNTPEHKYNIGVSGRDIPMLGFKKVGFNVNYRWVKSFVYEGSPQFTGLIPSYGLFDAQVNVGLNSINTIIKIGASNLLNNKVYQTYGGPRIGRMAYVSFIYDFKEK